MKINLRKANAIQTAINDAVRSINLKTNVEVNEFQDPEAAIKVAGDKFFADANRKHKLLVALYDIRKLVGQANSTVGVDAKLAEVAQLDKMIQFYGQYAGHDVREAGEVLVGKLEKIRGADEKYSMYHRSEVATSIFTQADVDGFRATVARDKKAKQKLQDEILELNVRTEITLSEDTVTTLTAEQLV